MSNEPVNMSISGDVERPKNTWICTSCGLHNINSICECELCGDVHA